MRVWVGVLAGITVAAHVVASMFLMVPFLIAEPGQPTGWFLPAVLWSLAESMWTWWVLVRRGAPVPSHRWQAAALLLAGLFLANLTGFSLLDERATWEAGLAVAGIGGVVVSRAARYWMRQPA